MRNVKVTGGSRLGVMKPHINSSPRQISRESLRSPREPLRVSGAREISGILQEPPRSHSGAAAEVTGAL